MSFISEMKAEFKKNNVDVKITKVPKSRKHYGEDKEIKELIEKLKSEL